MRRSARSVRGDFQEALTDTLLRHGSSTHAVPDQRIHMRSASRWLLRPYGPHHALASQSARSTSQLLLPRLWRDRHPLLPPRVHPYSDVSSYAYAHVSGHCNRACLSSYLVPVITMTMLLSTSTVDPFPSCPLPSPSLAPAAARTRGDSRSPCRGSRPSRAR